MSLPVLKRSQNSRRLPAWAMAVGIAALFLGIIGYGKAAGHWNGDVSDSCIANSFRTRTNSIIHNWRLVDSGRSRVQLDRLHHASNRSIGAGLIGLQPAAHGSKQSDQLPDHHIQHRTEVIRKIGAATYR
jgi:hypothetical protein